MIKAREKNNLFALFPFLEGGITTAMSDCFLENVKDMMMGPAAAVHYTYYPDATSVATGVTDISSTQCTTPGA